LLIKSNIIKGEEFKLKKRIALLLVFMLGLSALLTGCGGSTEQAAEESDVIKIGIFEPMTGANAAGGEMEVEGIKLANEMYPEVLGKKVELVIADNKSDKVEAANAATMLVDKEKVNAVIGSWGSSFSIAAGPIFKDAGIPAVGASCTNPLVTLGNEYYSRVCFIDSFQGTVMANYAYNELGAKKVAIIQEISSDYSVGLVKYFEDAFIGFTGNEDSIIGKASYNTGDQDFSAQLTNIKELNPDAIFAPGNYTEGALLVKQARELGIDVPFIATDTWEAPEFLEIGGQAVEGAVFSTFFTTEVPITEESEKFLKAYREKYDKEPASVTALGYDAYLVILNAIEKSGSTDPEEINKYIAQTKDFEGAAGMISLDPTGDAIKSAVIKEVKDGQFKYLTVVEPMQ
jgi:branched-chain amino acid transport system substrate-binding protein